MAIKDTMAAMRKAATEAREGIEITFGGKTFLVLAPDIDQMERWSNGTAGAAEILRTVLADPKTKKLIFDGASDEVINKCSSALVKRATLAVGEMMESTTGNFNSTATDKPSTE